VQPAGGPVPDELPPAALEALARGRRLEAVKIVRQAYGVGLKEAKSRVDVYELGRPSAHPSAPREDGGLRRVARRSSRWKRSATSTSTSCTRCRGRRWSR
jgi:hypothetical protein